MIPCVVWPTLSDPHCFIMIAGVSHVAGVPLILPVVTSRTSFLPSSTSSGTHTHIECSHVCFFFFLVMSLPIIFLNLVDAVFVFAPEVSRFLWHSLALCLFSSHQKHSPLNLPLLVSPPPPLHFLPIFPCPCSFLCLSMPSRSSRCSNVVDHILRLVPRGQSTWLWAGLTTSS